MARLRREDVAPRPASYGSDELGGPHEQNKTGLQRGADHTSSMESQRAKSRRSPLKQPLRLYREPGEHGLSESDGDRFMMPKRTAQESQPARRIKLLPLGASTVPEPLRNRISPLSSIEGLRTKPRFKSPKKAELRHQPEEPAVPEQSTTMEPSDSAEEIEVEESIWCGSQASSEDSEEELPSPRKFLALPRRPQQEASPGKASSLNTRPHLLQQLNELAITDSDNGPLPRPRYPEAKTLSQNSSRPTSSSDKENNAAILRFSPPRLHSPPKHNLNPRPVTPPQSPPKPRLQWPSKARTRIPTPPLRQSLDAFWNADTVNDWNEQYSPKKTVKSPRKLKLPRTETSQSPPSSPKKCQSPSKRTKSELEAKKAFETRKHHVAEAFLAELDRVVTQSRIEELAASTGGVRFIWSKTLNSTAGRANWRRETTKTRKLDGGTETVHKHHASIELAEKVINDEDRLLNVIAHEFCHLANFMVSGVKDQPHEWGRKCTQAFGHRGVEVTTKHSYQIEYKYIWQCCNEDCGVEFKRHSKSVDPKRHTCGSCRSTLVQIKPVPRKDAGNGTAYSSYVKVNFAAVKRGMPGASQKEVMEAVARKYRVDKELKTKSEMEDVARVLEFVTLDD
ncbi:hypothetical protein LTR37_012544 [Vermiconidia calcicola]|uniref:Uncharacterized protein n=1 Tax=Vermiconidia calcicola TaxID=1690605 RepID=A0ACC3MZ87_9PEZI|nr:hypothetical protein LTR37_012544 [Vermiconidia calcicola]